jgi:hypothetical protein
MHSVNLIVHYKEHTFDKLFNYFLILKPYFEKKEDAGMSVAKILYNNVPISILRNIPRIINVRILCDTGDNITLLEKVW